MNRPIDPVSAAEMRHERNTGSNEITDTAAELAIDAKVRDAMENSPLLVMEVVANDDDCIALVMEIAGFKPSAKAAERRFSDVTKMASASHYLNKLIADKLRDYVEH